MSNRNQIRNANIQVMQVYNIVYVARGVVIIYVMNAVSIERDISRWLDIFAVAIDWRLSQFSRLRTI